MTGDRIAGGVILSLGFWTCVVIAGVLFAAVSLSPRTVRLAQLERQFTERQGELRTLQNEVEHLERVAAALADDPRFLQAVAQHELHQVPAGSWSVPVAKDLRYDPRAAPPMPIDVTYREPWHLPMCSALAASPQRRLRWSLMAAGLLAFGFVFLHDHGGSRAVGHAVMRPISWWLARYRRSDSSSG